MENPWVFPWFPRKSDLKKLSLGHRTKSPVPGEAPMTCQKMLPSVSNKITNDCSLSYTKLIIYVNTVYTIMCKYIYIYIYIYDYTYKLYKYIDVEMCLHIISYEIIRYIYQYSKSQLGLMFCCGRCDWALGLVSPQMSLQTL